MKHFLSHMSVFNNKLSNYKAKPFGSKHKLFNKLSMSHTYVIYNAAPFQDTEIHF